MFTYFLISLMLLLAVTMVSSNNISYSTSFSSSFDFDITIFDTYTIATMVGPSDKWLGVGFGSRVMGGTYVIMYGEVGGADAGIHEYVLDGRDIGDRITPCNNGAETCAQLMNVTDDGSGNTIVTWLRENDPSDRNSDTFFVFENTAETIEMIWGIGRNFNPGNKHSSKGSVEAEFIAEDTDTNPDSVKSEYECLINDDLKGIDMEIYMKITAEEMEFELTGPSNRWFGVAWNGHFDGDALIYTTGKNDNQDLDAYDCSLSDQDQSGGTNNGIDNSQDWTINEIAEGGDSVTIKAVRALNVNDNNDVKFDFPPDNEEYFFVRGSSNDDFQLKYHGSNYIKLDVDLQSCTVSVIKDTDFTTAEHALFMILAFGIFAPWSALINRFLGFSICAKIGFLRQYSYLAVQIHKTMMIISWVLMMLGFITKLADKQSEMFDTLHDTIGFIVIIMMTLITFGTAFGNKQGKIVARHEGTGDRMAINGHRIFGLIFIIITFGVIMSGMSEHYGDDSSELTGFIAYIIILFILWGILELFGFINKDSMDKSLIATDETLPIIFSPLQGSSAQGTELVATHSDEVDNDTNKIRTQTDKQQSIKIDD